jgi:orotidine-5'-phosphate decarboxylase
VIARGPRLARERVIVALDVPDRAALGQLLDRLEGQPVFYKVGLELFVAEGAAAVELVQARGGRVFLDLKLHDIPETVARSVSAATRLGVDLLTVHVPGGREMMRRALEAAAGRVTLLGVTVLTSLGPRDLQEDGAALTPAELVASRARLAGEVGLPGLVCSAHEIGLARTSAPTCLLVVPGVRPSGAPAGDQKRVATPAEAARAGADFLVVGRPLRDAAVPAQAFADIVQEIESIA